MNRPPSSFRSLAVMYSRPYFAGGRPPVNRRGYSDGPLCPSTSVGHPELVSGDSHFGAVQEANRGFRPPPPQHVTGHQFNGPRSEPNWTGCPVFQQPSGSPGPYVHPRPVGPAFGNYQQFRPHRVTQQHRPRVSKPPDHRDWEYVKPGVPSHCERFTVLSYNILADYLATDHYHKLYFHIPRYLMDWNWRKRNIIFELGLWSAHILCFQEVDRFADLEAELRPRGYAGIWKMRTGDPADGCAIFWRVLRFKLLHEESIEYNKLGLRDNVAQICVFESLIGQNNSNGASNLSTSGSSASPNRVVVCNIHVLFNPKRGELKLGQIRALLDRAHAVSKLWDDAPVVICGDFNCTPKSPMYNFISDQKLDLSELDRDKVSGQASAEIRPPRPAYPCYRTQAADNSAQASAINFEEIEQRDLSRDTQNLACLQNSRNAPTTGIPQNHTQNPTSTSNSDTCQFNEPSEKLLPDSLENDNPDKPSDEPVSCESTSTDFGMDEKVGEDRDSFLSDLNNTGQSPLNFQENEIRMDIEYSSYSRSAWTPAEIQIATGSADNKIVQHPLKLYSAYADVENSYGLRDSSGEPFVTSYHRRFSGTVDYIWHSEGLRTAKILAPIPKHFMQQTRGFPTKKWGSDHIALVSEFAFNNDMSSKNAVDKQAGWDQRSRPDHSDLEHSTISSFDPDRPC